MFKKILDTGLGVTLSALLLPALVYAAAGLGYSSREALVGDLSMSDLIGITDVSDTTGEDPSDDGSSKHTTLQKVSDVMEETFTPTDKQIHIQPSTGIKFNGTDPLSIAIDPTVVASQSDLATGLAAVDTSETVSGGLSYSELTLASATTIGATADTWEIFDAFDTVMPSTGLTPSTANSNVPITLAGRYLLDADIGLAAGNDDVLRLGFCINSETSPLTSVGSGMATATLGASLSVSGYANLDLNDTVWVCAYNDTSSTDFDVVSANFMVNRVGEQITGAPTISSVGLSGAAGTAVTIAYSESMSVGSGGSGGLNLDCTESGDNNTLTYSAGLPGLTGYFTATNPIKSTDTCNLDYSQPVNGLEATTGGVDLASIEDVSVTNTSTYSPPSGLEVSDDFLTDTSADWAQVAGDAGEIAAGRFQATDDFVYAGWLYNTAISSANHYVAVTGKISVSGYLMAVVRATAGTNIMSGYVVILQDASLSLKSCTDISMGNSCDWIAQEQGTPTYATGIDMELKITVNSNDLLEVYVDNALKLTYDVSGGHSGTHVGGGTWAGSSELTTNIDKIEADSL